MATCPCSCGRRVGFTVKGAVVGVRAMDDLIATVTGHIQRELAASGDSAPPEEVGEFVEVGRRLGQMFLDHVHKPARPGQTPDLLALNRALAAYRRSVNQISEDYAQQATARPSPPPPGQATRMMVPAPVGMIMDNLRALFTAYIGVRRGLDQTEALIAALEEVFEGEELTQILHFISRDIEFYAELVKPCENVYRSEIHLRMSVGREHAGPEQPH